MQQNFIKKELEIQSENIIFIFNAMLKSFLYEPLWSLICWLLKLWKFLGNKLSWFSQLNSFWTSKLMIDRFLWFLKLMGELSLIKCILFVLRRLFEDS